MQTTDNSTAAKVIELAVRSSPCYPSISQFHSKNVHLLFKRFSQDLCGDIWVNILTLSPQRGRLKVMGTI